MCTQGYAEIGLLSIRLMAALPRVHHDETIIGSLMSQSESEEDEMHRVTQARNL